MSNDTDKVRRFLKSHTFSLHEGISLAYELFNGNVNNGYELAYCVFDHLFLNDGYEHTQIAMEAFYTASENQSPEFSRSVLYWVELQSQIGAIEEVEVTNDMTTGQMVADEARGAAEGDEDVRMAVQDYLRHGESAVV
jgi:hypothetical protein